MRIIAGTAKGRGLKGPKGEGLRPTSDRVRETIFNILGQTCEGLVVLDCFAGTGALAFEALSRGAARAVLLDNGREAQKLCLENATALGFAGKANFVFASFEARTILGLRTRGPFDLIFVDPPYAEVTPEQILKVLGPADLLQPGGRVVVEHDKRSEAPQEQDGFTLEDTRRFGDTSVSFYGRAANLTPPPSE